MACCCRGRTDHTELAEKIILLLEDAAWREKLGRQGREWVCQNFSWDRIAQLQEEVFDTVSGQHLPGEKLKS